MALNQETQLLHCDTCRQEIKVESDGGQVYFRISNDETEKVLELCDECFYRREKEE